MTYTTVPTVTTKWALNGDSGSQRPENSGLQDAVSQRPLGPDGEQLLDLGPARCLGRRFARILYFDYAQATLIRVSSRIRSKVESL